MTTIRKALEEVGASSTADVLGYYSAPNRERGEASILLLYADGEGKARSYVWGYYEERQGGWDWFGTSNDEGAARKGFLACIPVEQEFA